VWRALLDHGAPPPELKLNHPDHRLLYMLASILDTQRRPLAEQPAVLANLLANQPLRQELTELLALLEDGIRRPTRPHDLPIPAPLHLHADYQLAEIMAAMGVVDPTSTKLVRPQAGVFWHQRYSSDLFFITLDKSEKDYSPTTMYDDYPISPTLFHWQSQSTTREDSPTGRRYREHAQRGSHILLFVRRRKQDERRITAPYTFLGPATYESHHGERPMSITWRLRHPMPAELFEEMKVAAG